MILYPPREQSINIQIQIQIQVVTRPQVHVGQDMLIGRSLRRVGADLHALPGRHTG